MRDASVILGCVLSLTLAASCTSRASTIDGGSGGGDDVGSGADDAGLGPQDATDPADACGAGPSGLVQCSSVYVITGTQPPELYRFDPSCLRFERIGQVTCTGTGPFAATPYSMAVARDGVAWVLYTSGRIFHVDVSTAACTPTSFVMNQSGFLQFGMGFAADGPGASTETLYVSRNTTPYALASIDTASLALGPIGDYDLVSGRAELTGTGDGRLFGAFEGTPFVVAEIDRTDAHILSTAPQSVGMASSNFAFAAYGGRFYLFVGDGSYTDVVRYDPASGASETVVSHFTQEVVGAGVSTCAPI